MRFARLTSITTWSVCYIVSSIIRSHFKPFCTKYIRRAQHEREMVPGMIGTVRLFMDFYFIFFSIRAELVYLYECALVYISWPFELVKVNANRVLV